MPAPMLDQKLQAAQKQQARHWQVMLGLVAMAVIGAGLALLFTLDDGLFTASKPLDPPPVEQPADPVPPTPMAEAVPSPMDEEDRARFKQRFADFEAQLEPFLDSEAFRRWRPGLADRLLAEKQAAMDAFAVGRYQEALVKLDPVISEAEQARAALDQKLATLHDQATTALDADDAEAASLAIAEGLSLASGEMLERFHGLDAAQKALIEVLEILRQADIARTENRPERELELLQSALEWSPDRPGLQQRLEALETRMRDAAYAKAVQRSEQAIAEGKPSLARSALQAAREVKPDGPGLARLNRQIVDLERRIEFRRLVRKGEAATERDDWPSARDAFAAAVKIEATDSLAVKGLELSERMVGYGTRLDDILGRPDRLSSERIRDAAQAFLDDSAALTAISPGLSAKHAEARGLVEAYGAALAVTVVSDAETFVRVRSVGTVGQVSRKTIRLTPGRYIFEGRRDGYRSVSVNLELLPGSENTLVEVICRDPI
ncbi:MAG: hypothetical protein ACPGOV_08565 [Magnetovibrionaceae bacterium]